MDLRFIELVHGCVIWVGVDLDLHTGNALMAMYSKLETLGGNGGLSGVVGQVFDKMLKLGKMIDNDMPYVRRNSERVVPSSESFGTN